MYKVMIVEDQKMIRCLLESYINSDPQYQIVYSLAGANQAIDILQKDSVDLILMDVQTQYRENGLLAVKKIKEKKPQIKIIVVTSLVDYEVLQQAKKYGANSLWYKDGDEEKLMSIIRDTLTGKRIFPDDPPVVQIGTAKSNEFTKGEMRVLRCLVKGLSYGAIADELGIEVTTVKYHITNMLQKTNLKNKLQLALVASETKLVVEISDK